MTAAYEVSKTTVVYVSLIGVATYDGNMLRTNRIFKVHDAMQPSIWANQGKGTKKFMM